MNYLAERQACGELTDLEKHAHVVSANYICFVYLNESCFNRLKKLTRPDTAARKCLDFLTRNPVRAFRNAIAHSNWSASEGVMVFWARKSNGKNEPLCRFTVGDDERRFWFYLALCTATSAFAALTKR
jgi:hypothetical protein